MFGGSVLFNTVLSIVAVTIGRLRFIRNVSCFFGRPMVAPTFGYQIFSAVTISFCFFIFSLRKQSVARGLSVTFRFFRATNGRPYLWISNILGGDNFVLFFSILSLRKQSVARSLSVSFRFFRATNGLPLPLDIKYSRR